MTGKTVIITGGNRGIGRETARILAERNAKVIIGCRNMMSAKQTVRQLTDCNNNNLNISAKYLDLSSFDSIRSFAQNIINNESNVSTLICNAATIPAKGKTLTVDGLEEQFAVNHFGHFLLTNLLINKLIENGHSRIIVVSSLLHKFGYIEFDNLNFEKYEVDPYQVYCNTKLANILFTRELSKRLAGTSVTVNACHPGLVQTDIIEKLWYWKYILKPITYPIVAKTVNEGAQTVLHLTFSSKLQSITGKYFSDCKQKLPSNKCFDKIVGKKLWDISEKITKTKFKINF